MAIKYSVVKRKNPLKKDDPAKYYAQVQSSGEDNFKSMTRAVADRCTVTGSDAKAVLDAFMTVMLQRLANGQIVRLNDLGSFRISISSTGTENEKDINAAKITKARIIFTPCAELKAMCKSLTFSKAGVSQSSNDDSGDIDDPTA